MQAVIYQQYGSPEVLNLQDLPKPLPCDDEVLVIGASGSIGTYAVQLARHFGAHVTGVCSTKNFALVKTLGADRVIDYQQEDFTRQNEKYDMIFDTVGKSSFVACKPVLNDKGRYIPTVGLKNSVINRWTRLFRGKRVITGMSVHKTDLLREISALVENQKLRIVIDRRYPLRDIAAAHRYVETGHKRGNVVITVRHDSTSPAASKLEVSPASIT